MLPVYRFMRRHQRKQWTSDFALIQQARRRHLAESSSLSYGPIIRFQLLPTPPRGDAVTFSYGVDGLLR